MSVTAGGSPAGRVLALLERVQERPGLTASALAADLGVDERTVRRYVATLTGLGIPVVAPRGRRGGYRLEPGYRMAPLVLSTDEAVALTLTLTTLGVADEPGPVATGLAKLRQALPLGVAERVADVLAALAPPTRRDTLAAGALGRPSVLAALAGAVVARRTVRLRHRDATGRSTAREVNPYGVAVARGHLYVHGWCHLRRARRTFRVDRVDEVVLLDDTFSIPAGLDVAVAVESSLATAWEQWQVSVVLGAGIDEVRASIPGWIGTAEVVDETTTRLRLTTRNLDATVLRLSDHPFPLRVEHPAELREAFARRGRWMLQA